MTICAIAMNSAESSTKKPATPIKATIRNSTACSRLRDTITPPAATSVRMEST